MKISIYKGISPLKGDIAYTSIDSNGTPGYLNRYVLEELGYSVEEDLPKFDTLKISGVTMISYPEKNPIVFVVTINNEEKTENLLFDHLSIALDFACEKHPFETHWIPLMGTGTGGLSLEDSFRITLRAITTIKHDHLPQEIIISVPAELDQTKLEQFQIDANRLSADFPEINIKAAQKSLAALREASNIDFFKNFKGRFWWLNAAEEHFPSSGLKLKDEYKYFKFTGKEKRLRKNFNDLKIGDIAISYQKNPVGRLTSIFQVVDIDEENVIFRHVHELSNKILWSKLIKNEWFKETEIAKLKANGSIFPLTDVLFIALIQLTSSVFDVSEHINSYGFGFNAPFSKNRKLLSGSDEIDTFESKEPIGFENTPDQESQPNKTTDGTKKYIDYGYAEAISTDQGDQDSLGFTKDIQSLAALIALKEMKPPLAIALFGKWGSGKSFFMDCLERRVRELSKYQGFIELDGDLPEENDNEVFLKGIAHIKFNAWSYLDSNLWAGLVTTIFERLNQYLTDETNSNVARLIVQEKLVEQLKALNILSEEITGRKKSLELLKNAYQAEIENIEIKNQKLFDNEILNLINADSELKKLNEELRGNKLVPQELFTELKLDSLVKEVETWKIFCDNFRKRKALYKYLVSGIIGVSITILIYLYNSQFSGISWISIILFIGGPLGIDLNRLQKFKKVYKTVISFRNRFNELSQSNHAFKNAVDKFKDKIEIADKQILLAEKHSEELDEKIEKIKYDLKFNIADLTIADFVKERSNHNDYKKNTGIVSIVRRDFELLSELFLSKENEASLIDKTLFKEGKTLQRIVLYIDDLDRCTDEKVLEVLQAVHLLMAFPLFTVIVGVDERSVHNALRYQQLKRYQNIESSMVRDNIKEIDPREYLEKIFQIPFQLPEASDKGVEQLINHIIPYPDEEISNEMGEFEMGDHELISRGLIETPNKKLVDDKPTKNIVKEENNDYSRLVKTIIPEEIRITSNEKKYLQLFAPLVGNNPRTVKRYINIFRIVKTHEQVAVQTVEDTVKVIFLLAMFIGDRREQAIKIFKMEQNKPVSFITNKLDTKLHVYLDGLRKKDVVIHRIMGLTPNSYAEVLQFIERFSYKIALKEEKNETV